jgi:DNA-binding NtrC family response regulator
VQRWLVFGGKVIDKEDLSEELRQSGGPALDRPLGGEGAAPQLKKTEEETEDQKRASLEAEDHRRASLEAGDHRRASLEASVRPLSLAVEEAERAEISKAMQVYEHNLSRASSALGIERNTLKRKLRQFGMYPKE